MLLYVDTPTVFMCLKQKWEDEPHTLRKRAPVSFCLRRNSSSSSAAAAAASDMVVHKEFTTAGQVEGLQIWRIENLELVCVPENLFGNFYSGDAYVILYTIKQKENFFYHLHFWLGKISTVC